MTRPQNSPVSSETAARELCLTCGICCNGVLFKDVELRPADDATALSRLGLPVVSRGQKRVFAQPCQALQGCSCRIYPQRPTRCQQFECELFRSVLGGATSIPQALRTIKEARRRAGRVAVLLKELGDADETVALSIRFRRMRARFERAGGDETTVDRFAELTLAVHDLNVLLSETFYPG